MLTTVIGRGHSGTRAMSHTLSAAGVDMGSPLNKSGDLLPPEAMYAACRVMSPQVQWQGGLNWDFSALHTGPIPTAFATLIQRYLASVRHSSASHRGWKIPETTLVYPWICRLFPEVRYIFWVRDPRDCILGAHVTDRLGEFGIETPVCADLREQRAVSWYYQYALVQATPRPAHWIEVRFEDFVLRQDETLARLEAFLDLPLPRLPVRPEAVGRWKSDTEHKDYPFLESALHQYGYLHPRKKV